jgi:hypothetical protein
MEVAGILPELKKAMSPKMQSNVVSAQESLHKSLHSEHYELAWLDQSPAFVSQRTTRLHQPLLLSISGEHLADCKHLGVGGKLWRDVCYISLLWHFQFRVLWPSSLDLPIEIPSLSFNFLI